MSLDHFPIAAFDLEVLVLEPAASEPFFNLKLLLETLPLGQQLLELEWQCGDHFCSSCPSTNSHHCSESPRIERTPVQAALAPKKDHWRGALQESNRCEIEQASSITGLVVSNDLEIEITFLL